jgi:hypothetical protein
MKKYLKTVLALSLGGTLFAGYLSGIKLFSGQCAFNEPCPYFLGYPACWYGFAMFLAMFLTTTAALLGKLDAVKAKKANAAIAALGILFAGRYVVEEVANWFRYGFSWSQLGLPTCVYGLVFYIAIFAVSVRPAPAAEAPKPPQPK